MLRHTNIAPERAWYSWSSRPAELVFLPLGVRVTPVAYAGSTAKATLFPPGEGVRFGRHALDGSRITLDLAHGGTKLEWAWEKADPFAVAGSWRTAAFGEWGLRFWMNLCLSAEDGTPSHWDETLGAAWIKIDQRYIVLVSAETPVLVTGHDGVEALAAEYEAHGYFYPRSRAESAPAIALRFNLEMMRDMRFAVAVADRLDLAVARARALCATPTADAAPLHTGRHAGALDAIRDVMGWNTVWDAKNARAYTSISRNWNLAKFGGFGVWLNDQQYAAVMTGLLDPEVGRENLMATLAGATPQGNLPCLLTANDAWVDRTQLPMGSFLLWLMYLRSGSRPLLQLAYATLARNHAWWRANRDPEGRGLVSYGTSDVGEGMYKGSSFGARNESSMDNSPIHDEAVYDPATRSITTIDVGLNSLLALDAEMLALIAAELGDADEAVRYRDLAEDTRQRVRTELWDEGRGIFANRLRSGAFVRSVGPTSFYPLVAGIPTPEQTDRLVAHLADPATFGGRFVIPGTSRDDPAARDNSYWRGRIWPPLNYLVWQGLRRAGRRAEASAVATASLALFEAAWARGLCPENYNAETGEPLDQPDTEGFYNWGALMPLMAVGEIMDVAPWSGWEIVNDGAPVRLGPLESPVGPVTVAVADGVLTLSRGTVPVLSTTVRGRITGLSVTAARFAATLPEGEGGEVRLSGFADPLVARCGATEATWRRDGVDIVVAAPPGPAQTLLVIAA